MRRKGKGRRGRGEKRGTGFNQGKRGLEKGGERVIRRGERRKGKKRKRNGNVREEEERNIHKKVGKGKKWEGGKISIGIKEGKGRNKRGKGEEKKG